MPVVSRVKYKQFKEYVEEALLSAKDANKDDEYRVRVGEAARDFKNFRFGKYTHGMDKKWEDWLGEIRAEFSDDDWNNIGITQQKIKDMRNTGEGALENAFAIHYRLHAETETPRFARRIDELEINNGTLGSKYPALIFERREDDGRLQPTHPSFIELQDSYQHKRPEFFEAKEALLAGDDNSVALSTAIHGAGGYGKSSLAQELCNDEDIRAKFLGGIYWLQFGRTESREEGADIVRFPDAADRMLKAQYAKDQQPSLGSDADILSLLAFLPDAPLLIVADDIWDGRQTAWLSNAPNGISILMTTRRQSIAATAGVNIDIQRLADDASQRLLSHGMTPGSASLDERLRQLARGFKGWPLLLNLANGVFRQLSGDMETRVATAIKKYETFLSDDQISGWDIEENGEEGQTKRRKLVGYCIEAGLSAIHPNNSPDLLRDFAVFPDDIDIPFSAIIELWRRLATENISDSRGETLLRHFNDFSFFSSFDENAEALRVHDEILAYFRGNLRPDQRQALHQVVVQSVRDHCSGDWHTLPQSHRYGWAHILYHLEEAGMSDLADDLRTDFHWLKAKLAAVGVGELQRSFIPIRIRPDARNVGRAVKLCVHILTKRPSALAPQLYGRLGHESNIRLRDLAEAARTDPDSWLFPTKPHLFPLGRELIRLVGHDDNVSYAAFVPNCDRVATVSSDNIARLWDGDTGELIGERFKGHQGSVIKPVFDPTGTKIATDSLEDTVQIWNAETGEPIGRPVRGRRHYITSTAFDPTGTKIVTVTSDNKLRLWIVETGEPIGKPLEGHRARITSISFDHTGSKLVSASEDRIARLWDAKTGEPIGEPLCGHPDLVDRNASELAISTHVIVANDDIGKRWDENPDEPEPLVEHQKPYFSAAFDPTGKKIVTSLSGETTQLWSVDTGARIGKPLEGHVTFPAASAFNPTGTKILTVTGDNIGRLWNAETGDPISKPLEGHQAPITRSIFDPTGTKIVTSTHYDAPRVWNTETAEPIGKPLEQLPRGFVSATFDPTGRKLVTCSWDRIAWLWDVGTTEIIGEPLEGHHAWVLDATFNSTGNRIITSSWDKTARIWDANADKAVDSQLERRRDGILHLGFDPTGKSVVTISKDRNTRIWDTQSGEPIGRSLEGHDDVVVSAAFDSSGSRIVTVSEDKTARLWNARTGEPLCKPLKGHRKRVVDAAFDPSSNRIVTASEDRTARLWNAETGEPIGKPLRDPYSGLVNASFDPKGNKILTVSRGTARLWDANTGKMIGVLFHSFEHSIVHAAFDPEGSKIVTASAEGTILLWNAKTAEPLSKLIYAHSDRIVSAEFDPTGSKIVTISWDKTARLSHAETGAPVGERFLGHSEWVVDAAFHPTGRRVITVSHDGTARLWDVASTACLDILDFDDQLRGVAWYREYILIVSTEGRFHRLDCRRNATRC